MNNVSICVATANWKVAHLKQGVCHRRCGPPMVPTSAPEQWQLQPQHGMIKVTASHIYYADASLNVLVDKVQEKILQYEKGEN